MKIYNSQQAYDNAAEPYDDDCDEDGATQEILETIDSAICEFHYNNENF